MKVKEKSKKIGLKLNIQKTKIMASAPITSWEIGGETVADFILRGCVYLPSAKGSYAVHVCEQASDLEVARLCPGDPSSS